MKTKIAIAAMALTFLVSCEEVMEDFKLESANPEVVIEANVSSFDSTAVVSIKKTAEFLNPDTIPIVKNALVTLSFADTMLFLTEKEPGQYVANFAFPEETEYRLHIEADGKEYNAVSFMPQVVSWDSISVKKSDYNDFIPLENDSASLYSILAYFTDPAYKKNYYRFMAGKNDSSYNSIDVLDDELISGSSSSGSVMDFFESGDTVWYELQSIDKANYQYYLTLNAALMNNGMFSAPDNPVTNIEGANLGHFCAYSKAHLYVVIP